MIILNFPIPDNLSYWLTIVKLFGWLFSGVVTAVLVIVINEWLTWRKRQIYRKNLVLLLICELSSNLKLLYTYFYEYFGHTNLMFSSTVWINSSNEIAHILPQKVLCELFVIYHKLHYLELFPDTNQDELTAIESNILEVQKQLAQMIHMPQGYKSKEE